MEVGRKINRNSIWTLGLLLSISLPAFAQDASQAAIFASQRGIIPITYQSGNIDFSDWISLFTLCFTPLLAHVIAGVPETVHLAHGRPQWHDRICHFNPTSILWRYFIILDRRVRAKSWNAADMAASNANFWTSRGWDGSEEMMKNSQTFCTRLPTGTHTTILSSTFTKTVIITLQGVQAIYTLVASAGRRSNYTVTIAVDSIFFPLAVLGLLRLLAAMWLTDEYTYTEQDAMEQPSSYTLSVLASTKPSSTIEQQPFSTTSLLEPSYHPDDHFHSLSSCRAVAVRLLYFLPIVGLLAVCVILVFGLGSPHFSATNFVMSLFYLFFLATTILIFAFYFLRGQTTTTCLPCINSLWYKIYTGMLTALMVLLIVIASVETRRSPCGPYTTFPALLDQGICSGFPVASNATQGPFAVATWLPVGNNETATVDEREMRAVYFDGWCQGTAGDFVDLERLNETVTP